MVHTKRTDTNKSQSVALKEIDWANNNYELVFTLLDQLERPENFKVLFGKKDSSENTSRKSKVSVYRSIAEALFPEEFKTHADQLVSRIKTRVQTLRNQYSTHAKRLQRTGEGIQDEFEASAEVNELMVPACGPDHSTSSHARNIWDDIVQKCPYFPVLHRILCARPNITPPAITTGVGPNGHHTVYLPPPRQRSDSPDIPVDPALTSQTPTFSQPLFGSPSPSQSDSRYPSQDLEPSPPPHMQMFSPPPSQHPAQQFRSLSQPPIGKNKNTGRGSRQKPPVSVDDFLANISPKPRLKRSRGAEDVYEMIETVVSNHTKLEIQRHEAETCERELRLITIEWEQLLKERSQVLQEMQVGLRTLDEAKACLEEMDKLHAALMKRLGHTRSPDLNGDLVLDEDKGGDCLQTISQDYGIPHYL